MTTLEIWQKAKEWIKTQVGATAYEAWFGPLRGKESGSHKLILQAPDGFFKDWIIDHYSDLIQKAMKAVGAGEVQIEFQVNPNLLDRGDLKRLEEFKSRMQEPQDSLALNPRYTFENFVLGSSNRFAHAYSLAVAESPARAYNPLFIYGGVGLGKTHLMQAVCHKARFSHDGQLKIVYTTSEQFTNELIRAIQHHATQNFRQKYRTVDILVIDDIHFIAGKESTQEEFFHTFNTLYDAHKQIIISSDRSPKEIPRLEERLVSRFSWGLVTDIQPPDLETRIAILKKKIEKEPTQIPDEVVYFIAQLIKTNIRELEGALIRVIAYALLEDKPITLELTKDVLRDLFKEPKKLITIDQILRYIAEEFNISLHELKGRKRTKGIVSTRQVAMYLSRELTDLSLSEIGESFGGKDHTTVLYAYNKIQVELNKNIELQEKINRLVHNIKSY